MKHLINQTLFILLALVSTQKLICQNAEKHDVLEVYKKVYLEFGSLDENGSPIDFVFQKSTLEKGTFPVVIQKGPGNLFEITGTDYYITFATGFRTEEYGKESKLIVGEGYKDIKVLSGYPTN